MPDSPLRTLAFLAAFLAAFLTGCAFLPEPGSEVTAAVRKLTAADEQRLKPVERQKLQAAGVTSDDIAAGRLVHVACAVMTDGTWGSLGVLPPGLHVDNRDVVRVRVTDVGSNDYDGVNEVLGVVHPRLTSGQAAYRAIPDWRERGLRNNIERLALPANLRDKYLVVHSAYTIKCRQ